MTDSREAPLTPASSGSSEGDPWAAGRPFTVSTEGEHETEAVGEQLARAVAPDGVVLLHGEMGSGKTVLVRGMARALGVDQREVQSPTYTLIHQHRAAGDRGRAMRLTHVDLYRLELAELPALGLDEILAADGVKAVEWAERLAEPPAAAWRVVITGLASRREIEIVPPAGWLPESSRSRAES